MLKSSASGLKMTESGDVGLCPVNTSIGLCPPKRGDGVLLRCRARSVSRAQRTLGHLNSNVTVNVAQRVVDYVCFSFACSFVVCSHISLSSHPLPFTSILLVIPHSGMQQLIHNGVAVATTAKVRYTPSVMPQPSPSF